MLGVAPERVVVDQVGLNHLTWIRARARRRRRRARRRCSADARRRASPRDVELPRQLLDELGAIPSYYLRYFYRHDAGARRAARRDAARGQVVAEIERELLELYRDPALDEKPALLEQRGGAFYSEAATRPRRLARHRRRRRARVDVRNDGTLAGPRRRRRRRGAGAHRARTAPCRCRRRRSRRSCSASSSTSPPTSGSRSPRRVDRRPRRRAQGAARPSADRAGALDGELVERLLAADERLPSRATGARSVSDRLVLAVDGGNSKTDLALVAIDGDVLALVRGPPQLAAPPRRRRHASAVLERLARARRSRRRGPRRTARRRRGRRASARRRRLPERGGGRRARALEARGWAARDVGRQRHVRRAARRHRARLGRRRSPAAPASTASASARTGARCASRRSARSPATGAAGTTSGSPPVSAAARSEDGRGPRTSLEQAVPAHFGLRTPGPSSRRRSTASEIARAAGDRARAARLRRGGRRCVAAEIVDRLAAEIVTLARVALDAARPDRREPSRSARRRHAPIARRAAARGDRPRPARASGPAVAAHVADSPPIVGAALLGLDAVGADAEAARRIRAELSAAVDRFEATRSPATRQTPIWRSNDG